MIILANLIPKRPGSVIIPANLSPSKSLRSIKFEHKEKPIKKIAYKEAGKLTKNKLIVCGSAIANENKE